MILKQTQTWIQRNCKFGKQQTFEWYNPYEHYTVTTPEEVEPPEEDAPEGEQPLSPVFHGTARQFLGSISQQGLIPQVGSLVEQFYGSSEYPEPEELVFFSSGDDPHSAMTAMVWAVGKALGYGWPHSEVTPQDVVKYGIVLVLQPETGMYRSEEDGTSTDIVSGDKTYETPVNVEPGDVWSRDEHLPSEIISGTTLLEWIGQVDPRFYRSLWENAKKKPQVTPA